MHEILALSRRLHAAHEKLPLARGLIENTGIRKRHLAQPLVQTLQQPGFEIRNRVYLSEAGARVPPAALQALTPADVPAEDIDAVVFISRTGFNILPLSASMINAIGLRKEPRQISLAQLSCTADSAAIKRAHDFCMAYLAATLLVVACESCSLCYQPTDLGVGSLLPSGLLGDVMAAAVTRGTGGPEMRLERNTTCLVPGTWDWSCYDARKFGFPVQLDRRAPGTVPMGAPSLHTLADAQGWDASQIDVYVIHAGGPRILDDLSRYLAVDSDLFRHSPVTERVRHHRFGGGARRPAPPLRRGSSDRSPRHSRQVRPRHHRRSVHGDLKQRQRPTLGPHRGRIRGPHDSIHHRFSITFPRWTAHR
jgi:1,3,6,8-tetrahydroxynaphthalene synthase